MKKFFNFVLALSLFVACTNDTTQDVLFRKPQTLRVAFEEDSRIELDRNHKTIWNSGDLVSVFYESDGNSMYEFTGETGDTDGILETVVDGSSTTTSEDVVLVYPYNENYTISHKDKSVNVVIPSVQNYNDVYGGSSYGIGDNLMVAYGKGDAFTLRNVCGYLEVVLSSYNTELLKSLVVKGNNDESIAGNVKVNYQDLSIQFADDSELAKQIRIDFIKESGMSSVRKDLRILIALAPQIFSKGITITAVSKDDAYMTLTTEKEIVITRNRIQPMSSASYSPKFDLNPEGIPNNEIWYEGVWDFSSSFDVNAYATFGAEFESCTTNRNLGKLIFDRDVTTIGGFVGSRIRKMVVPKSVTLIKSPAFSSSELESIILPSQGITEIASFAFSGCRALKDIVIPTTVTTIGDRAFRECISLKEIAIPESATNIVGNPFQYCTNLAKFEGKNVSKDGRCVVIDGKLIAFAGAGITEYVIPEGVTSVGDHAFVNCKELTSITIPEGVTEIGGYAFYKCENLSTVNLPNSLERIYEGAFSGCKSLNNVIIPENITRIDDYVFYNCPNIVVNCLPLAPPSIGFDVFVDGAIINVFNQSLNAYINHWGSKYGKMIRPEWREITETTTFTYQTNNSQPAVNVQKNVAVKSNTYTDGIGTVVLYGKLTRMPSYMFQDCDNVTHVTIPDGITTIGKYAFNGLTYTLTSVHIPNTVTKIEDIAFGYIYYMQSITIPESVVEIGQAAFINCSDLTSITIPDSVTKVGRSLFSGCYKLNSVKLSKNLKVITEDMFEGCRSLENITIPESVVEIGANAFTGCESLTSITIPVGVTKIAERTFNKCESLTSITIPEGVAEIGESAFHNCRSLNSITIPESVTSIGSSAFLNCPFGAGFYCKRATPPAIKSDPFGYMSSFKIYVPRASVDAYKAADGWKYYASVIEGYDF